MLLSAKLWHGKKERHRGSAQFSLQKSNTASKETLKPNRLSDLGLSTNTANEEEVGAEGSKAGTNGIKDNLNDHNHNTSTVEVTEGTGVNGVQGKILIQLPNDNPACPFCGDHVGKSSAPSIHLKRNHGGKDVEFQCSLCKKSDPKGPQSHIAKCKGRTAEEQQVTGLVKYVPSDLTPKLVSLNIRK